MRTAAPALLVISGTDTKNKRTRNRERIRTNQSNARHVPPSSRVSTTGEWRWCDAMVGAPASPSVQEEGSDTQHTPSLASACDGFSDCGVASLLRLLAFLRCWLCGVWCFAPLLFSASSFPLFFSDFVRDTKNTCTTGHKTKKHKPNDYCVIGSTDDGKLLAISAAGFCGLSHPESSLSFAPRHEILVR